MAIRKKRLFLIFVVALFIVIVLLLRLTPRVEQGTVLSIRLTGQIQEEKPSGLGSGLFGTEVRTLRELLESLERARTDPRIAGVSLEVHRAPNIGMTQELRSALQDFTAAGKFCSAYLGEGSNLEYYLATACPEIFLTPTSSLFLSGLMASQTFYRGFLDNLRIYPDLYSIAEYKTARNVYTEKKFTREHRRMLQSLLTGLQEQINRGIRQGRELSRSEVEAALRAGPFLAAEAVERGLVNRLLYYDEYLDHVRARSGRAELERISPGDYLRRTDPDTGPMIAIVHVTGLLVTGESGDGAMTGRQAGSRTITRALREAREDRRVRAIVLRVNSPGGSPLASEAIRRELELAQRAGKPVVVSMSNVAASGGYWIAMSADRILSDPGTLTGSIGVVFGKLNIEGFYKLLGFTTDHIALTPNATFFYPNRNFTPEQRQAVHKIMGDIYQNFIEGVAEGRAMTPQEVDKIARGRVWLGSQAKELGLVDELGGLAESLAAAKELAGIPASEPISRIILPRPKSRWELMQDWLGSSAVSRSPLEELRRIEKLSLFRERGWVLMPLLPEIR